MASEEICVQSAMSISKEFLKEVPRELNRFYRDKFKASVTTQGLVKKEILTYSNGAFTKTTDIEGIAKSGELEGYMQAVLPEGETSAKLGLITVDSGPFIIGFLRVNPSSPYSHVNLIVFIKEEHRDYLTPYLQGATMERKIKKYARFILPSVTLEPEQMSLTPQQLNELLSSGNGQVVQVTDEQVKELGLDVSNSMKVDEFTQKRLLNQSVDGSDFNITFNPNK